MSDFIPFDHWVKFHDAVLSLAPGESFTYWRGCTLLDPHNPCPGWLREMSLAYSSDKEHRIRGRLQYTEPAKYALFQRRNGPSDFSYIIARVAPLNLKKAA